MNDEFTTRSSIFNFATPTNLYLIQVILLRFRNTNWNLFFYLSPLQRIFTFRNEVGMTMARFIYSYMKIAILISKQTFFSSWWTAILSNWNSIKTQFNGKEYKIEGKHAIKFQIKSASFLQFREFEKRFGEFVEVFFGLKVIFFVNWLWAKCRSTYWN